MYGSVLGCGRLLRASAECEAVGTGRFWCMAVWERVGGCLSGMASVQCKGVERGRVQGARESTSSCVVCSSVGGCAKLLQVSVQCKGVGIVRGVRQCARVWEAAHG